MSDVGMTVSDIDRFWSKVDRREEGECWPWTAATSCGYGRFYLRARLLLAHRVAWLIAGRDLPGDGRVLDHLCRNRRCVNPKHLRLVTNATNVRCGDKAKLDAGKVAELRALHRAGATFRELGERFGVSTSTAGYAATGRTWRADV